MSIAVGKKKEICVMGHDKRCVILTTERRYNDDDDDYGTKSLTLYFTAEMWRLNLSAE